MSATPWWARAPYLAALCLLIAVPLLWPAIPPLADLPAHIGRYRVELGIGHSPWLARYYAFRWRPIGNLGVDLLMLPMVPAVGLEPAVKLVTLAIPVLTAAGMVAVAREAHGRAPPATAFALPLALGYPFTFGFANFTLAAALALLAFALWLRLGRIGQAVLRGALFAALAPIVWVAHVFGWAMLVLLCGAAELVRWRERGATWRMVPLRAGVTCLPLLPPLLLMLLWRGHGGGGATGGFFAWTLKFGWLQSALRDRWVQLDGDAALLLLAIAIAGIAGLASTSRVLLAGTAALAAAYAALPQLLLGSFYADMRLAPYLLAFALLSLDMPRLGGPRAGHAVAAAALAFCLFRVAANTASFALYDRDHARMLAALDHLPSGARVLFLDAPACPRGWAVPRAEHLGSLAIARRDALVNDEFTLPGAAMLTLRAPLPDGYALDPSELVRLPGCDRDEPLLADKIARMPRDAFDYVWLVEVPPAARPRDPGLRLAWADGDAALYRVAR